MVLCFLSFKQVRFLKQVYLQKIFGKSVSSCWALLQFFFNECFVVSHTETVLNITLFLLGSLPMIYSFLPLRLVYTVKFSWIFFLCFSMQKTPFFMTQSKCCHFCKSLFLPHANSSFQYVPVLFCQTYIILLLLRYYF